MRMNFKYYLFLSIILIFMGCADKNNKELFNLSPEAWYSQIIKDIKNSDLDSADKHYISFSSEHVASPLLEQILIILAQAHIDNEEYILANFYLDEYIKRYGTEKSIEFAKYLKIKANFDSFSKPYRNQKLMEDSINSINNFLKDYPNTEYRPLIETMLVKFKLAVYYLNIQIESLYDRTGRTQSADIYKDRIKESPLHDIMATNPTLPWYMRLFE